MPRSCVAACAVQGQALYCQASAHQSQGELERAVQLYKQAAELWKGQPVVWLGLVHAYRAQKLPLQALAALETALAMDEQLRSQGQAEVYSLRGGLAALRS